MKLLLKSIILLFVLSTSNLVQAGEGMWLPIFLKALNESEMQSMGMKISADDIYNVNKGSLKDAIVHFGGFCTSEIISPNGLMLTNHHCGYSQIQSHSTIEDNYLKNGFWAADYNEEKPNPGLTATLIQRIEDVTKDALKGVTEDMDDKARQSMIDKNLETIRATVKKESYEDIIIRPFYNGNQYFMFVTIVYKDVRLVGTPPESIGKFGADTDNWVWPRHTGDFSLFRIYADENNLPAEYSPENKPYKPKHFLPIAIDGVEKDDFTMVFGFPGRTNQYLPKAAVEQTVNVLNPARIKVREASLAVMDKFMRQDEASRLQYAPKFASIANYWKKWIGESTGLKSTGAIAKKEKLEKEFQKRAEEMNKAKYKNMISDFNNLYEANAELSEVKAYYDEIFGRNIDALRSANTVSRLLRIYENNGADAYNGQKGRYINYFKNFFKNYNADIDKEVFSKLVPMYKESVDARYVPMVSHASKMMSSVKTPLDEANEFYKNSILDDGDALIAAIDGDPKKLKEMMDRDGLYVLRKGLNEMYAAEIAPGYEKNITAINSLQRKYMAAQMELFPNKRFFPDANSTMRVTYGKVDGYKPKDAVCYEPVSYLEGVMEKYKPGDYEFDVDEKLIALYETKDYGDYGIDGKMPVCFIGTNHTTGGNSGSPAIDAHGNLIGLNFYRAWEGTMSDINYDSSICRNIMVDIRYVLFIIDKHGGAGHLVEEMVLVRPKK